MQRLGLFSNLQPRGVSDPSLSVAVGVFSTRGCCQKSTRLFLKFYSYFNLRLICKFHRKRHHFRNFFKFNIRLFLNIFRGLRPKRIQLCVSEDRSQKLILVTNSTVPEMEIDIFHNDSACPIRKSEICPNSIVISKLWLVYITLSYFRSYILGVLRNGLV